MESIEGDFHLAVIFHEHAAVRVATPRDPAALEELLRRAWEAGRAPWPHVALSAEVFVRHLAQRLSETAKGDQLALLLEQLALADLYLACACVQGVTAAIETLERHYLAKLPAALAYLRQPGTLIEDVCQTVRMHLLLGTSEAGPRLSEYTGRGALPSWIRVIAVRMVLKQAAPRQQTPEESLPDIFTDSPTPGPDPELDLIKSRYRREFRQAVREAFSVLSSEQRHMLQLHFIDRLSTVEMGTLFRVNQSTISRWLKSARETVFTETKRRLQERLGLSSHEFASLLAAISSQLDLSISQVLEEEDDPAPSE